MGYDRLQSGAFPLSNFAASKVVADHGDPRTQFKAYLDVQIQEARGVVVEGLEAYRGEVREVRGMA